MSTEEIAVESIRAFYGAIESTYREKVEAIEGCALDRVMVNTNGARLVTPDGRTILTWRGLPIVEWDAFPMGWSEDGTRAVITFRTTI